MAFNARQIYPNDLNPGRAIGVDLPLNGNAVFTPTIKQKML